MKLDPFKEELTVDQIKQLKSFVYNLRNKAKRKLLESEKAEIVEQDMTERTKRFVNQKLFDLHNAILLAQSADERASIIRDKIDENQFNFLEYMDNYPVPSPDFLRVIVALEDQLDSQDFTHLFVRVCAKYQGG